MSGRWGRWGAGLLVLRRAALLAVLAAVALRVGDVAAPRDDRLPQLDVVVALDRTTSMSAADDPAGSRLAGARADLVALGEAMPDARIAVVAFGGRARLELPLTTDRRTLDRVLAGTRPEAPTSARGTSVARAVPLVEAVLAATERPGTDRRRLLVLATDGEDTARRASGSYEPLAGAVDAGVVLGYGTAEGGRMPLPGGAGPTFVPDARTGQPALSRLDGDALRTIADEVDVPYVHRTGRGGMADVADDLRRAALADVPPAAPERQVGWLWGLLLLGLTLPELRRGWRAWLEARREGRS